MAFSDLIDNIDRQVLAHCGGVDVGYSTEVRAVESGSARATESGATRSVEESLSVTVKGIFDEQYILSDPGGAGVEQITPMVWLQLEDLPDDPRTGNPIITIAGQLYTVRERPTDGVGGSIRLALRRSGM